MSEHFATAFADFGTSKSLRTILISSGVLAISSNGSPGHTEVPFKSNHRSGIVVVPCWLLSLIGLPYAVAMQ